MARKPDFSAIPTTGPDANPPLVNVGSVDNTGLDFSIGYNNETKSGITYSVSANISTYDNEVTSLINPFQSGNTVFRGGAVTRTQIGRSISEFYWRVFEGVFQNEAEYSHCQEKSQQQAAQIA